MAILNQRLRALTLGVCMAAALPACAQHLALPEAEVKAGFLYNFAKLTEWPTDAFADADSPIVIGVLGKDPVQAALEKIVAGKAIDGRKIVVRRYESAARARDCHVLFVSASYAGRLPQVFQALAGHGVLTVGDTGQFTNRGGMIELVKDEDTIRLKINVEAARGDGLKLSSKLLRLATIVTSDRKGEKG